MKCLAIRSTILSNHHYFTNRQKWPISHWLPNILYTMLPPGPFSILSSRFLYVSGSNNHRIYCKNCNPVCPATLFLWILQSVCKHLSRRNPGFTFLPINILSVSVSNHCATRCLIQVTVCAELENRIRLSLCTLHCDQFNIQDALSCKSRESSLFIKIGQFLPKPNNGLPNFTFLQQPQAALSPSLHKPLKNLPTVWAPLKLHAILVKDAWIL